MRLLLLFIILIFYKGILLLFLFVYRNLSMNKCYNFNKLGGRENDPKGCAWADSYVHDQCRNFSAQHEVMGYLEKDTCIKRDFWTACSRMSIEDQLYGLAFASETDQDLCMAVTCARRWSEVEDALAESCAAANTTIQPGAGSPETISLDSHSSDVSSVMIVPCWNCRIRTAGFKLPRYD